MSYRFGFWQNVSEKLNEVSGGANEDFSYLIHLDVPCSALGRATNPLEPGTTPAPSRLEEAP